MSNLAEAMAVMGSRARAAAHALAAAPGAARAQAVRIAAAETRARADAILAANDAELEAARRAGAGGAFLDRMRLDSSRIEAIAGGLEAVAAFPDPIGETIERWTRPNGLVIERVRAPIGVVAVVYESRPNVTLDAAAICLMAGSASILRGGSECVATSGALFDAFAAGLAAAALPADAAQFVRTTDRAAVGHLLSGLDGAVDLVIPRGGKSLVARVRDEARVAVLSHLDGNNHVYVDATADLDMATRIVVNAKMRRPGVCGAAETLLIDRAGADRFAPTLVAALQAAGCAVRADPAIRALVDGAEPAGASDWDTEYLDAIIAVAMVEGVEGAIVHIARHGSGHTDAIVAGDARVAERFLSAVDSAIVLHNASTQFADGGEFGLGAEIGIATGKLHARGPVGVRELTTWKNVVRGAGQIRPA